MKNLYILIGPKGSGKTYIGQLIEKELKIFFLEIESIFLRLKNKLTTSNNEYIQSASTMVKQEILDNLNSKSSIIFESTGTAPQFKNLLEELKSENITIKLINIISPLDICSERIKSRDQSKHIQISDEMIEVINQQAIKQDYRYDLKIDNLNMSDDEIIKLFKQLIVS